MSRSPTSNSGAAAPAEDAQRRTSREVRLGAFWSLALACAVLLQGLASFVVERYPSAVLADLSAMWAYAGQRAAMRRSLPDARVFLGDSRLKAGVRPEMFGDDTRNLTMPGASPFALDVLLQRYLQAGPAPKQLLVSVAPVHLRSPIVFWEYSLKFGLLRAEDIDRFHQVVERTGDDNYGGSLWRRGKVALTRVHALPLYFGELSEALLSNRAAKYSLVYEELRRSRGHKFFGTAERSDGLSYETDADTFNVFPAMDAFLRSLLQRAADSGADVRFLVLPINEASSRAMTPRYRQGFRSYLAQLASSFPTVLFDRGFDVYPASAFGDPNHLNARGAQRYGRELAERLKGRTPGPQAQ